MIMPSREELKKIRECILFPFLLRVIERDRELITHTPLKFKETYEQVFAYVADRVFKDMVASYDEIKAMNVKIYEQKRDAKGLRIRFVWKGYHNETYYRWIDMKEDIKKKIMDYFAGEQKDSLFKK